ncbi:hypothetical protein KC345_g38 [Hortaea werneckii]|nr:hypothetical protein KC345_g38 [Hortaea werneckii]
MVHLDFFGLAGGLGLMTALCRCQLPPRRKRSSNSSACSRTSGSSLRSSFVPTSMIGTPGAWCSISGYHFALTLSKDDGLTIEKHMRKTLVVDHYTRGVIIEADCAPSPVTTHCASCQLSPSPKLKELSPPSVTALPELP